MDTFGEIIGFIGTYFIRGIFVSVLVIIFSRKFFKKRFDTQYAVDIIKWIMLCYAVLILVNFLLLLLLPANSDDGALSVRERATGPYAWAFWLMTLGAILPLILLFKKIGANVFLVFALSISMNLGWLMESLVIHTTKMKRDYNGEMSGLMAYFPFDKELITLLKGFILGLLVIISGNLIFFIKKQLAAKH